ncbi:capsule biosynthesis protein [uncultured Tateyamaria sp.]|uniref:capsule biosynthesis protein n=1 Tax=uncultured Tateyamaria sp. TaxID=455651 RepID=UPI002603262F|nr:capsule biosynthesis protein [uncultured Tateyamaria sp.]
MADSSKYPASTPQDSTDSDAPAFSSARPRVLRTGPNAAVAETAEPAGHEADDMTISQQTESVDQDSDANSSDSDEAAARLDEIKRERLDMARRKEELKAIKMRRDLEQLEALVENPTEQVAHEQPAAVTPPVVAPQIPSAPPARTRSRHWVALISFLVMVVVPVIVSFWYLTERAAPRYASMSGFSVRNEEVGSAVDLLGAVTQISGSSSSDPDILYQFIQSQELVARADAALNLRALWAKGDPDHDPVFAYHPPGTIEDLVTYWERMVGVYSDSGTGLIDVEVQAFSPEDARRINQFIYDESSEMINRLSAIAREDATRYARDELETTVEQVKVARQALTRFRNETQIVDPEASIQSQMGILSSLQAQLAETLIDLDILLQTSSRQDDPRIIQTRRRIEVIEVRINEEQQKLGLGDSGGATDEDAFANLVGEYERLLVDREFAEQSFAASRTAYDAAVAEARRQTRYLAAHVQPTLAESAKYPQVYQALGLVGLFSFLLWAILALSAYALRDRR